MKILHLLASPVFSGPAENVLLLAQEQCRLGHQAYVLVDRKREGSSSEEPIVPRMKEANILADLGVELSVKSSLIDMWRDVRQLKQTQFDVFHSHFSHDHFLASFAKPRESTLIRSIHSPRSLRRWMPRADGFTVPSLDMVGKVRHHPTVTLRALRSADFRPPTDVGAIRRSLGLPEKKLIGMFSTFQASRRHDLALEAFSELLHHQPGVHSVLLGDGILESAIRTNVQILELVDHVTFAGYQLGASFIQWMQAMDEIWVLGLGNDYTGRIAAQARSCGVRVVCANEGALPELADVTLKSLTARELVQASMQTVRRTILLPSNQKIAEDIITFYQEVAKK